MTSFRQLYDPGTGTHYLLDSKALVFKVSSDEVNKETRLKPHFSQILTALFSGHPQPVSYKEITNILRCNQLACPDETRLHRKVSELRIFLAKFHPGLDHLISNTRLALPTNNLIVFYHIHESSPATPNTDHSRWRVSISTNVTSELGNPCICLLY